MTRELTLKSQRFRAEREADWLRLERLLADLESGHRKRLSDDDVIALPVLYRATLSSLSMARSISLDRNLVDYLESLSTRAYFFVYGARVSLGDRVARFFLYDWPQAVKNLWRETLVSGGLLALGTAVALFLVLHDSTWYDVFIPSWLNGGRSPSSSTAELAKTLAGAASTNGLSTFAGFLFTHNAQIALFAFALGFVFCLPTGFLMLSNGLTTGAFLALFVARGLGVPMGGWLLIHGVTELLAVTLAGAAGFRIGWGIAFPGRKARLQAATDAGRDAATVMAGAILMLAVAGLLEGFGRQLIVATPARYAIAILSALGWGAYFYLAEAAMMRAADFQRELITPEGIDLKLMLADAGERVAAFFLDLLVILAILIGLTLAVFALGLAFEFRSADAMGAIWLLGFFLLRNFYFMAFELTPRAATPGKRMSGLRVAMRDGSPLTANAIFARNAMRELEIFLPLSFLARNSSQVDAWIGLVGLAWCGTFLFFPLLNRDRLRLGDLVGGTWVVKAPRRVLDREVGHDTSSDLRSGPAPARAAIAFSSAALDAYGIKELNILEAVLRRQDQATMRAVAERIRAKIGFIEPMPDADFLNAYYFALRGRLETGLLFGKRKKDKYEKV